MRAFFTFINISHKKSPIFADGAFMLNYSMKNKKRE